MKKHNSNSTHLLITLGLFLSLVGCHVDVYHEPPPPPCYQGRNGVTGQAFFALNYSVAKPLYIWGNNPSFPNHFYFDTYYFTYPGSYQLYYEGAFYNGPNYVEYYWDVNYEIWVNPGSYGGPCYDGANGADSYLSLWLDPYGPGVERINKKEVEYELISSSSDKIEIELKNSGGGMRATFLRLTESKKGLHDHGSEYIVK